MIRWITLLLFFVGFSKSYAWESQMYFDLTTGQTYYFNTSSNSFLLGHERFPASFCKNNDEFYCISSHRVKFSIPKNENRLIKGDSWIMDGLLYCQIGATKIETQGRYSDAYLIAMTKKDNCEDILYPGPRLLFSYEIGLIYIDLILDSSDDDEDFSRLFKVAEKGYPFEN